MLDTLNAEGDKPNAEQMEVLTKVKQRVLDECELDNEQVMLKKHNNTGQIHDSRQEALRGFIHGLPGTGKSRVIKWIIRMFTEALKWKMGDEFLCVPTGHYKIDVLVMSHRCRV